MNITTINNVMRDKNMKQQELSKLSGISAPDLCKMLNYKKTASDIYLKKMYMALHIDFKREDEGKSYPPVFSANQISLRKNVDSTEDKSNDVADKKPVKKAMPKLKSADKVPVDFEKIKSSCKERGLTLFDLALLIGKGKYYVKDIKNKCDCKAPFETVKLIASKLKVSPEDIIDMPALRGESATDSSAKVKSKSSKDKASEKSASKVELKHIDTQDVFENFKIINENLIAYAKEKDSEIASLIKTVDNCQSMITSLTAQVSNMEDVLSKFLKDTEKPSSVIAKPKVDVDIIAEKTKNNCKDINYYIKAYDKDDSFDEYAKKINAMVTHIKNNTGKIHNQVFHEMYNKLNTIYGANLDGMKKEFIRRFGRKPVSTVEEIYVNEIFRNIFYNLVADEAKNNSKAS